MCSTLDKCAIYKNLSQVLETWCASMLTLAQPSFKPMKLSLALAILYKYIVLFKLSLLLLIVSDLSGKVVTTYFTFS